MEILNAKVMLKLGSAIWGLYSGLYGGLYGESLYGAYIGAYMGVENWVNSTSTRYILLSGLKT